MISENDSRKLKWLQKRADVAPDVGGCPNPEQSHTGQEYSVQSTS